MTNNQLNFNKSIISALPTPPQGRTYYRDNLTRGLMLDVQCSGTKTFRVNRKVNGIATKVTLGKFDLSLPESRDFPAGTDPLALVGNTAHLNVRMARKLAEAVNAAIDRGENPTREARQERVQANNELTLREAFDMYHRDHLVAHDKRTAVDLSNDFCRYLGKVAPGQKKLRGREKTKPAGSVNWEDRKLSSISAGDVRVMKSGMKDSIGSRTANKVLVLLRSIYNKMIEWRMYRGENPCTGIEKFAEVSRDRFVKSDELPRFMTALQAVQHDDFKDFVLLSLYTAMRRANVLALEWQNLNFDARIIAVPSNISKTGVPLFIPMTEPVYEILQRRKAVVGMKRDGFVFPAKGTSGHMAPPNKRWKALLVSAGIPDLHMHDLRRSLASYAAMGGTSLIVIGKMLGHTSSEATAVYARLQLDPVAAAMEDATRAILAKSNPLIHDPIALKKRQEKLGPPS